ncbi:MAG TPA: ribosome maturation factor RimM [Candidatus Polarisedimenticolia bacterium]|nr:ribosome maturation factor RimM [Candidatus Polarisedimenticolia bacterium]
MAAEPRPALIAVATGLRLRGAGGRLTATLVPGGIDQLQGRRSVFVGHSALESGREMEIESSTTYGRRLAIKFRGVDDAAAAEALAGLDLLLPAASLQDLPDGSYYIHELVGMQVRTRAGRIVGTVRRVLEAGGAAPLLAVVPDGGADEVLIPAAQSICVAIDRAARTVIVDPPEGLLEIE